MANSSWSGAGTARRVVVAIGLAVAVAACGNAYPPELVPPVPDESAAPEFYQPAPEGGYGIAAGDRLLVNSYYHPNLKQTVTVQPDGRVSLLLLGTVAVAGKSTEELGKELVAAYEKHIERPDFAVTVEESAALAVYVGGEVAKPSMLPIRGEMTLLQSITEAGGFLPTANREQVLIVRKAEDGRFRTVQANIESVLSNKSGEIYLRRRDIVFVPKSAIAKADQFVDQYINQIIPRSVNTVFGFSYPLAGSGGSATIITPGR